MKCVIVVKQFCMVGRSYLGKKIENIWLKLTCQNEDIDEETDSQFPENMPLRFYYICK